MAEIFVFTPLRNLSARENVDAFVSKCRSELQVFKAVRFEETAWDITDEVDRKGRDGRVRAIFTTFATRKAGYGKGNQMAEPFLSFAKAYFAYQWAYTPSRSFHSTINALRAVEAVLTQGNGSADITRLNDDLLNQAASLVREELSTSAYAVGQKLQKLGEFVVKNCFAHSLSEWWNPIKIDAGAGNWVGKEFDEAREKMLPSREALEAVAEAFVKARMPGDILTYSVCALLAATPDRVNEVLRLEANCEHYANTSVGNPAYGLRWKGSKGADDFIKWMLPAMCDVAKLALSKIRAITEEARHVARWREANPGKLYLPPSLEHLRHQETVATEEASRIIFLDEEARNSRVTGFLRLRGIQPAVRRQKLKGESYQWKFSDIEKALLSMMPPTFPYADRKSKLRFSDALFVTLENQLIPHCLTYRGVIAPFTYTDLQWRLNPRKSDYSTLIDELGLRELDGSRIRITTHQFRHYLNTLAQTSGMSQVDIAMWSGRVNIHQNSVYDHESARDLNARMLGKMGESFDDYGAVDVPSEKKMTLLPRSEFLSLKLKRGGAIHTTEFGYCIRDWVMNPCETHADCINCEEEVCIKGERDKEANVRLLRSETSELLTLADTASSDGKYGANRWVEHQRLTLARLDQLCAIYDDPGVPEGAVIKLSDVVSASRIHQAHARRLGCDVLDIESHALPAHEVKPAEISAADMTALMFDEDEE